jgi:5-methyltetrahydrofolate--homocysteine methyltransferase
MDKAKLLEIINRRVLLLDGATGTELQKRGMPEGVCPELWCLENPGPLMEIHRAYQSAGSDVVYACTFGANRLKIAEYGSHDVTGVNRRLAELARKSVPGSLVAGDLAPTGRFVEPFGPLSFEEAVGVYKEQVQGLLEGGVDLFVIETMIDIQETRAALIAVRELTEAFCMVTMTYEASGRTLNGTDPLSALVTLQALGADAVGCNCSTGPGEMLEIVRALKPYAKVPLVAKPNAGLPVLRDGRTVFEMGPAEFGAYAKAFVEAGVNIMGGCCGTTPEFIAALRDGFEGVAPQPPAVQALGALSSARRTLVLRDGGPTVIIGERINPTGKKQLQAELKEGQLAFVRQAASEQEQAGAEVLDVNVGMPGIDEAAVSNKVVGFLATATDLPLCIDSADVRTIESSLRLYPGRALINSISGEPGKLDVLAPLAAKYGAMFILLPLEGGGVPVQSRERTAVIEKLCNRLAGYGFGKEDMIVDGLTMAVSADPRAGRETLDTLAWCRRSGLRTILGVSNVSFGLPERRFINAGFMAMAIAEGLTMAIANPMIQELTALKLAADVLTGRDPKAERFIEFATAGGAAAPGAPAPAGKAAPPPAATPAEKVRQAVIEGRREEIQTLVSAALDSGVSPQTLVDGFMIPAIQQVGAFYEQKIYFLPQLIASAEAMQRGFGVVEPILKASTSAQQVKGRIIMATVQGDVHDIGKNIVCLLLRNNGFEVLDLGKDVKHETLIAAIERERPDLVGLSALMTTTMVNMKTTIEMARGRGIATPFLVGGAVVTEGFADSIGASYASDGVAAVKTAERLLAGR